MDYNRKLTERTYDPGLAMINIGMKSFWRGALDRLADIEVKSYDDTLGADGIAAQFRNCRICVEESGEVLGFYIVVIDEKNIGQIERFAVAPSWRRQYVGSCMMDDLLQEGSELNAFTIRINEYNEPATWFLAKFEFKCVKQIRHAEADSTDYLFMRRFGGTHVAHLQT